VTTARIIEKAKAAHDLPSPSMQKAIVDGSGVPQTDLAEEIGVHRVTFNRWVMGHRRPTGEHLVRYVALLEALQEAAR
jgi:plasmid maintenance system antidote protein VapI